MTLTRLLSADPTWQGTPPFSHSTAFTAGSVGKALQRRGKSATDAPYSAAGDNTIDDTAAFDAWLTALCANGGSGYVPDGTYKLTQAVTAPLNASVDIRVSAKAKFVAASGFAANSDMIQITTGTGTGHTFKWIGGEFDATNQPNSGVGQSNDIFSFNAENCSHCHIELDKTTAGADWLNSGSDSHLFIGGPSNIRAYIWNCVGATDAGIYISRNIDGDAGECLDTGGNFYKCSVGVIVKRQFETVNIQANVVDCLNGVGTGTADITGVAVAGCGSGYTIRVNAKRTERPCVMSAMDGGQVFVQAEDMGVDITGYSSPVCMALYLTGSTNVQAFVNAHGVNSTLSVNNNFRAVYCDQRATTAATLQATDNIAHINCSGLGRAFAEANSANRNTFIVKSRSMSTTPTVVGTYTFYQDFNSDSSGWAYNVSQISFGGLTGSEALRVVQTASQVNWLQMTGSVTGGASGVSISATGADANVPFSITTKGTGTMFLGGAAGSETLRLSKVASQVNAIEITGAATGNNPSIVARGSDADLDLSLTPKGVGNVRFGTHGAIGAETVSGFITIKDAAGNARKLAVVS